MRSSQPVVFSRPPLAQPSVVQTGAAAGVDAGFYALRAGRLWGFLKSQPASFWLINIYLFFEYVRPQQIYRWIDVLPWAWGALWLSLAAFLVEGAGFRRLYVADKLLAAFCLWVFVCCMTASYPDISFSKWSDFYSWILIYLLITNIVNTERRYLLFMLGFLLYSTKMSQHGFRTFVERGGEFASYGAAGSPGWFSNSGEFGIQMCIFFPLAVYFVQALRPFWSRRKALLFLFMPASAAISIVASSSRGAVLGLIPVVLWMMLKSKRRVKSLGLAAVVGVAIWFLLPAEQKDRFSAMGEDETSQSRIAYWEVGLDMMRNNPVTGVGYKNWMKYNIENYKPHINPNTGQAMWQLPHNIFIEVGAELGYVGLGLFFVLIGGMLYTNAQTRKVSRRLPGGGRLATGLSHGLDAGLWGYLAAGFFVTVFYYPFFWISYALTVALHHTVVMQASRATPRVAMVRG